MAMIEKFVQSGHFVEIRSLDPGVVVIRNDNHLSDWKEVRATVLEALQKAWEARERGWKA